MDEHKKHLKRAIALGIEKMNQGFGGPFGAVVVRNGVVVAEGWNCVTSTNDPTAHAEVTAIRRACESLKKFQLDDCIVYSSCEPCPMCLGAIYWARPKQLFFAADRKQAAGAGFDDDFIYKEIPLEIEKRKLSTQQLLADEAQKAFDLWMSKTDKILY